MEAVAQTVRTCEGGHALRAFITPGVGKCDGCGKEVAKGSRVKDCRACNYYLCAECFPETTCPSSHALESYVTPHVGDCDGCGREIIEGSTVMDCRACNWFLCGQCTPAAVADVQTTPPQEDSSDADLAPPDQPRIASVERRDLVAEVEVERRDLVAEVEVETPATPQADTAVRPIPETAESAQTPVLLVQLLDECAENDEGRTLFDIQVQTANGTKKLQRRYSEFRTLRDGLREPRQRCVGGAPSESNESSFPRKHARRLNNERLAERRIALDAWLQSVLPNQPRDLARLDSRLATFLELTPAAPVAQEGHC